MQGFNPYFVLMYIRMALCIAVHYSAKVEIKSYGYVFTALVSLLFIEKGDFLNSYF